MESVWIFLYFFNCLEFYLGEELYAVFDLNFDFGSMLKEVESFYCKDRGIEDGSDYILFLLVVVV